MRDLFDLSTIGQLVVAFVVVFILIFLAFWLLRRFGGTRIGGASRGRQPRLAVIDAAAVDGRRRLVLIRRDNVEHLVMIGGPTDVVIEQNIVRAVPVAPARDAPGRPPGAPEPRVEAPAAEPTARPPRVAAADDGWPGEPPLRPQRPEATWAGPAETSLRPYRPPPPSEDARIPPPEPRAPRIEPSLRGAPTPRADAARPEPPIRAEPPVRNERREPSLRAPAPEVPPVAPAPAPAGDKPTSEPTTVARTPPLAPDANLADMAQRLEAALRRPIRPSGERATEAKPTPAAEPSPRPAAPAPGASGNEAAGGKNESSGGKEGANPANPPRASAAESKSASPKSVLDSLEEEMASLLGRPAGKE
jgi:flagellar protein FliO/FliZ